MNMSERDKLVELIKPTHTITIDLKSEDDDVVDDLKHIIMSIAPYMVDNVVVAVKK